MFSTLYTISECIIIILTSLCPVLYILSQNVLLLRLCNTIYYIFIIDAVLTDGGMLVLDETGDAHTLSEVEGMLMYRLHYVQYFIYYLRMYYYYSDFTIFSTLYTISECIIIILTSLCPVLYILSQNVLLLF
jgi:hypothetical protein